MIIRTTEKSFFSVVRIVVVYHMYKLIFKCFLFHDVVDVLKVEVSKVNRILISFK